MSIEIEDKVECSWCGKMCAEEELHEGISWDYLCKKCGKELEENDFE